MKTRIATIVASLLVASFGTAAFAQAQQTPPQRPMQPQQTMPQQQPMSQQTMPPDQNNPAMSSSSMSTPDQKIEQHIKRELTMHGVTATNVTVTFQDGTATLSGTVASKRDIRKAKSAAMRVRGVKHVDTSGLHAGQGGQQQ